MYKYTDADKLIEILARNRVRILKECAEWIGLSMGPIINKIEYHNYLANKPLSYFVPGGEAYDRLLLEGEYIWVHDGNSIDITGKKIGVLGDSLTQYFESDIRKCIENIGGIPVCKGSTSNISLSAARNGYTLIVGASFNSFAKEKTDWSDLQDCDYIITELCTNDIAGPFQLSYLTDGMNKVAQKLKGKKVYSLGIMPYAFSLLEGNNMNGMNFSGVVKYAKENGDEKTVNYIHEAQRKQCESLGWTFLDSKNLNSYEKWYDTSKNARMRGEGDGIHISNQIPFSTWFDGILSLAFKGGHWKQKPMLSDDIKDYEGPDDNDYGSPKFPKNVGAKMDPNEGYSLRIFGYDDKEDKDNNKVYQPKECCKKIMQVIKECVTKYNAHTFGEIGLAVVYQIRGSWLEHRRQILSEGKGIHPNSKELVTAEEYINYCEGFIGDLSMYCHKKYDENFDPNNNKHIFLVMTYLSRRMNGINCENYAQNVLNIRVK